jgi:type 1 glutamine amidotransferase
VLKGEIYQMKDFSRDKVRILMRLDAGRLDLNNPRVHRKDLDFAVTWAKMYGKGRVFFSAVDSIYRIRRATGDLYYGSFWDETIRWLATYTLAGAPRTRRTFHHSTGTRNASVHASSR